LAVTLLDISLEGDWDVEGLDSISFNDSTWQWTVDDLALDIDLALVIWQQDLACTEFSDSTAWQQSLVIDRNFDDETEWTLEWALDGFNGSSD